MLLSWQLVLIFLCMGPFVVGLIAIFGKKMKRATKKSLVAGSQMLAKLNGVMAGLKVVKVYNRQDYERAHFKTINSRLLRQLLTIAKVNAATTPTLEVFGMIGDCAKIQGPADGDLFSVDLDFFTFCKAISIVWQQSCASQIGIQRISRVQMGFSKKGFFQWVDFDRGFFAFLNHFIFGSRGIIFFLCAGKRNSCHKTDSYYQFEFKIHTRGKIYIRLNYLR